jgi:hypothetical protein
MPRGGSETFRPINSSALSKDQNDLGKRGYKSKIRIIELALNVKLHKKGAEGQGRLCLGVV